MNVTMTNKTGYNRIFRDSPMISGRTVTGRYLGAYVSISAVLRSTVFDGAYYWSNFVYNGKSYWIVTGNQYDENKWVSIEIVGDRGIVSIWSRSDWSADVLSSDICFFYVNRDKFLHFGNDNQLKELVASIEGLPVRWSSESSFDIPSEPRIGRYMTVGAIKHGRYMLSDFWTNSDRTVFYAMVTDNTYWSTSSYNADPQPHVTLGSYLLGSDYANFDKRLIETRARL